jgi:transposase InsO family protein
MPKKGHTEEHIVAVLQQGKAVQAGTADCAHQAAADHRPPTALATPLATTVKQCWRVDLVSDKLADGRSFHILTVVDQFTRERLDPNKRKARTLLKKYF